MRDFAAILRRELEHLEAQIAADPRLRKARKIRELLAVYEETEDAGRLGAPNNSPAPRAAVPLLLAGRTRPRGIRWVLRRFTRPGGSATVARSRLVAISQSNHWANASPAWLQLQKDASGRPLSYENVFGPGQAVVSGTVVLQAVPPAIGHQSGEREISADTATAQAQNERRPARDNPVGLVAKALKTA